MKTNIDIDNVVSEIKSFIKDEASDKLFRETIHSVCNYFLRSPIRDHHYIYNAFESILNAINLAKSNNIVELNKALHEDILPKMSNINPLQRISTKRKSLSAIRLAVSDNIKGINKSQLKRDALYFDHFVFSECINQIEEDSELHWLNQNDIILPLEFDKLYKEGYKKSEGTFIDKMMKREIELTFDYDKAVDKMHGLMKLMVSDGISEIPNFNGTPWYKNENEYISSTKKDSKSCLNIVLKALPIPDETTPWEAIIDFRNNEESILKRNALLVWQNKISKQELTINEIGDEIEYLLNEYQSELSRHKIKSRISTIKTIVVAVPELIENIVKLKFKNIAENIFSFAESRADLSDKIANIPGKEIAYISMAREKFS